MLAPDASFDVSTYLHATGDLIVLINRQTVQPLTVCLETMQGQAVARVPLLRHQTQSGLRLNVSELTDGDYRLVVAGQTGKVVKIISLTTTAVAEPIMRHATLAVVESVLAN